MKKLIFTLVTALSITFGAASLAGTVTFVNKYDRPVEFAISHGSLYKPLWIGVLEPGARHTTEVKGHFTQHFYTMAFPPSQTTITTDCGSPRYAVDSVTIEAFASSYDNKFSCRLYMEQPVHHEKKMVYHESMSYHQ